MMSEYNIFANNCVKLYILCTLVNKECNEIKIILFLNSQTSFTRRVFVSLRQQKVYVSKYVN